MPKWLCNIQIDLGFFCFFFYCKGWGEGVCRENALISKQKVKTLLETCHTLLFQSAIFNPLENASGEGFWQRTQEEYATLGAPPQYWYQAWRECCFCLRGSLWQKQELYGELITTAQEAWSHAHHRAAFLSLLSRDFLSNSSSIYSILLILKTNPSVLVTIHCQKKDRAGQDLQCNQ